jgi:hypothetical protein
LRATSKLRTAPCGGAGVRKRHLYRRAKWRQDDRHNPLTTKEAIPMADEVTKKDLQSLQGYVNKQIGDLEKQLKKAEGDISVLQDIPTKQDDAISKLFMAITDKLAVKISALESEVKALKEKSST